MGRNFVENHSKQARRLCDMTEFHEHDYEDTR